MGLHLVERRVRGGRGRRDRVPLSLQSQPTGGSARPQPRSGRAVGHHPVGMTLADHPPTMKTAPHTKRVRV